MTDMPTNLGTVVATGAGTVEGAMRTAWGFHHAAGELEALQRSRENPPNLDQAWLDQLMGRTAGAVVLEALALEVVLKARLLRAGIPVALTHDHSALYALLPETEKQEAEQRYQSAGWPPMQAVTLAEALSASANVFVEWRYAYEHAWVQTSTGEMRRAFTALAGAR